jgi:hypothetical protein
LGFDITVTGFEVPEIDLILQQAEVKPGADDAFQTPSGPSFSCPGDLWVLDKHRIYCSNSLDGQSYRKLVGDHKADGQSNYQTLSQNPYLGGIPGGKLSATPVLLSLDDAVALGLKQNLGAVLATDVVTDARGQHWQALSELLPNVVTNTGFGVHQINVKAAFGLTIPNEPPIIGPFGYFDARAWVPARTVGDS